MRRSVQGWVRVSTHRKGWYLTVPSTPVRRVVWSGMTKVRGKPASGGRTFVPHPCMRRVQRPEPIMQCCASQRSSEAADPFCVTASKPSQDAGHRHLEPSSATCHEPVRTGAKTVRCCRGTSLQCAGRRTTPSGTTPSRMKCHSAMSSLRARATIIFLREPRAFSVRA